MAITNPEASARTVEIGTDKVEVNKMQKKPEHMGIKPVIFNAIAFLSGRLAIANPVTGLKLFEKHKWGGL